MAAADVDLLVNLDDFEFDMDDDFDVVIEALDLDLSADDDFRGGACYSAIFSDADSVSHCRNACDGGDGDSDGSAAALGAWLLAGLGDDDDDDDCGDGADEEEGAGSSSPAESGVTDDGSLAPEAGDDADDAMAISAYVAELERFLLEDDDDEQAEVDHQGLLLGVVDDYFAGDHLLATAEVVPGLPSAGGAGRTDREEEEEENADCVLAAREDEQSASRKRARNKIKGTAMLLTPWGELEVMNNLTIIHLVQI